MNTQWGIPRSLAALAAVGLAIVGGPALAQETQEITVTAPREVTHKVVGRTSSGLPVEQISISHRVGFKDLDLKKDEDVQLLQQRVKDAAKTGCKELSDLYPDSQYPPVESNRNCVQNAVDSAKTQVDTIVASARK